MNSFNGSHLFLSNIGDYETMYRCTVRRADSDYTTPIVIKSIIQGLQSQESGVNGPHFFRYGVRRRRLTPHFVEIGCYTHCVAVRAVESALIGSRPQAFQRTKDEACMLVTAYPNVPKGWLETRICFFLQINFNKILFY